MSLQLPELFQKQMQELLKAEYDAFNISIHQESPVSIRLNPKKKVSKFDDFEKIVWAENGRYLPERPKFTLDPLLHSGAYYVQEASSMVLDFVFKKLFNPSETLTVLDLCAAPGGKSTLLASNLNSESTLVANEVIKSRVPILEENLIKWGEPNIIITNNDSADFKKISNFFDFVVIDAPCSGEGLFRKDHNAVKEWSLENVEICTLRQKRIVDNVLNSIKEGGYLFYSTCTYNAKEDEENVNYLLDNPDFEIVTFDFDKSWGIESFDNKSYHFFPHKTKGEGFFFAVFKKNSSDNKPTELRFKKNNQVVTKDWNVILEKYFPDYQQYKYDSYAEKLNIIPANTYNVFNTLKDYLYIKKVGVSVGELKGKEWIPSHEIALSSINVVGLEKNELELNDALKYLKKDTNLSFTFEGKGFQLVTYKGITIGWVKVIGNRINNYFPKEWRILMEI